ncbi:DNA alkylation repair enzyme [Candidatus Bilamarchaeum dharawalense]|uniref:DNA alkylation repair enzyme n=1 Tax=Candidatus Bilamarchaeum dharawalense TaxID=2885759 RepID=A0A5E4LWL3_9ARCH|nr:DNA alkylation repair enzyme [Candidatus Bilamarchaeum dharawalense]
MVPNRSSDSSSIVKTLKAMANPKNVEGMVRFGISPNNTLGVSIPVLRKIAKEFGKNHQLAQELWDSEIHEARILAGLIADPKLLTEKQMDLWVKDFDSWDVCDQVCMNLFDKTEFAYRKAVEWTVSEEEFVRRAGFALMAVLAVHDKKIPDSKLEACYPLIEKYAYDDRNFVRKAVNWALRQIGKRNKNLNRSAIQVAEKILKQDSKSAKWIANDALRELKSEAVQKRLNKN